MVSMPDVFHRALRALLAYDIDAYAEVFAEEGTLEWPFAPPDWARRLEGREAIRAHVGANLTRSKAAGRTLAALHDVHLHEAPPRTLVAEFSVEVRSADGSSQRLPYVHVLEITNDGRIASLRDYFGAATSRAASSARSAGAQAFGRLEQAFRAMDADAFADAFAPDGVLAWPFALEGLPRRLEGREAIREATRAMMARADAARRRLVQYRDVVHHPTIDPYVSVVEFRAERQFASGATSALPYIWVLEMRGEAIAELRDYYDSDGARRLAT